MTEKTPKYLEEKKMKNRSLITRYKCGNETKGNQHWREEDDRRCRICQRKFHILKECEATKNELRIEEFVGEEAKGLKLIKWIEKLRRENIRGK